MNDFVKQERIVSFKNKNFKRFNWDIITHCNYKCSYCYARANEEDWLKISRNNIITEVIEKMKLITHPIDMILLGGEPTLHPQYFEILDRLDNIENMKSIRILSNGNYGSFEKMKIFVDKHKHLKTPFSFLLTYHVDEVKDENEFFKTINYIKDKYYLEVNILFDDANIDKNLKLMRKIYNMDIIVRPSLIFEDDTYKIIPEPQLSIFKNKISKMLKDFEIKNELKFIKEDKTFELHNDFSLYLKDFIGFKGWKCWMSEFFIQIGASDIREFCSERIVDIDYINNNKYIVCQLDNCICPGKISLKKEKI